MPVALRLPVTVVLLALCVLIAATRADAVAPTPVLWGGKVTTDATGSGTYNSVSDRFKAKDGFSLTVHTERIVPNLFHPLGEGVGLVDDGGSGDGATKWDVHVGTGSSWWQSSHLDDDENVVWDAPVSCTVTGEQIDPGALSVPDADESPRLMWVSPLTRIVDFPSQCDNGRPEGSANAGSDLSFDLNDAATFDLGGQQPPTRSTWSQNFGVSRSKDCGTASSTCTETYGGDGTATIACALCVTDMKLEHRDQSNGGALIEVPAEGTTDGNRLWVTAKVMNKTDYPYKAAVQWRERTTGRYLMSVGAPTPITTFPANQTTTVVLELDTSGFAYEKFAPHTDRQIELMTPLGGGFVKVKVLPKPIIMAHGWKADASGWDTAKGLTAAVHPELPARSFAVGDGKAYGIMDTSPTDGKGISENAGEEHTYIEGIRAKVDAEHVDLLVHSMGGLISRAYINSYMPESKDGKPVASNLLMFGTPNMGSPCADLMAPALRGLPTQQLRPAFVDKIFNKTITNAKRVPFAILAGDYMPTTCGSFKEGDGVVEVESAYWTIADRTRANMHHIGLTDVPEYYSGWVKGRIALDPDRAGNASQWDPSQFPQDLAGRRAAASRAAAAPAAGETLDVVAAETVTVPAGGSVDVPVELADGTALVAAHDAPAGVAARLVAPSGASVQVVDADSAPARQPVRAHRVDRPMAGVWRLRLSQPGGATRTVHASLAVAGSALTLRTAVAGGELTATLRDGDAGVPGATVTAELRSATSGTRTVALSGGAGGVYSAPVAELPADDWFAVVVAKAGDRTRVAAETVASRTPVPDPGGGGGGGGGDVPGGDDTPAADGQTPAPAPASLTQQPATPQPAPPAAQPARATPRALRLTAKAARDRRKPYAFTLSGRMTVPAGTSCKGGPVAIQVALGKRVLVARQVTLGADCRFAAKVVVKKQGRLRAVARFLGTPKLAPTRSRALALRAG